MEPLERIQKRLEVKAEQAELQQNHIRVVPSVMGSIDCGGDVIFPGAFKKVIKSFLASGFVADTHGWDWKDIVAMPLTMEEQGKLLLSDAEFHSTPDAQAVRVKVAERLSRNLSVGASVGFYMAKNGRAYFDNGEALLKYAEEIGTDMSLFDVKGIKAWPDWCRAITELEELYEYSIVPVPMMRSAQVIDAKSAEEYAEEKGVSGSTTLPLAARDAAWDSSAADKRVREWAGATDAPNAKYRRAFFWYDGAAPENFTSYKLGFADVVDGTLKAMPRGVMACAGGHGVDATTGIPDGDKTLIKSKINRYYSRMRQAFNDDTLVSPFEDTSGKSVITVPDGDSIVKIERLSEMEDLLRDAGGFSRAQAKTFLSHSKTLLLREAASEANPPAETTAGVTSETPAAPPPEPEPTPPPDETPIALKIQRQRLAGKLYQQFLATGGK